MKKTLLIGLATGLFVFGLAGVVNAAPYQGFLYDSVTVSPSGNLTAAQQALQNLQNGSAVPFLDATFTVEDINFNSQRLSGANTYTQFFQGGATNINGLSSLSALAGNTISTGANVAALVKITGQAYFDSTIDITHDDGFMLKLGNTLYDFSFPTSPEVDTISITAGIYNFEIFYEAWNGNPEVLMIDGMTAVPEPATMLLFGTGIAGLAAVGRRRRS